MKQNKLRTLYEKDMTKKILASLLSILIGLVVGSVIIAAVGFSNPELGASSVWDGIRIVFAGLFSTGRTAAGRIADGVADEEQHERQHVDERRKAEHAAGLALDEHAVADAGIGMVARGDVERLGLQTAAAAALGAVMAARRTARYLDLCPAAGEQLFDGSLLGHFDSVLIFTLVIAYSGLYSSMMRNAARMPSTAADMMPPA